MNYASIYCITFKIQHGIIKNHAVLHYAAAMFC